LAARKTPRETANSEPPSKETERCHGDISLRDLAIANASRLAGPIGVHCRAYRSAAWRKTAEAPVIGGFEEAALTVVVSLDDVPGHAGLRRLPLGILADAVGESPTLPRNRNPLSACRINPMSESSVQLVRIRFSNPCFYERQTAYRQPSSPPWYRRTSRHPSAHPAATHL